MNEHKTVFALVEMTVMAGSPGSPANLEAVLNEMARSFAGRDYPECRFTFLRPFSPPATGEGEPCQAAPVLAMDSSSRLLTRRQNEVARFVQQGLSNKEIARKLGISPATVKNHVHTILEKLDIDRRTKIRPSGYLGRL